MFLIFTIIWTRFGYIHYSLIFYIFKLVLFETVPTRIHLIAAIARTSLTIQNDHFNNDLVKPFRVITKYSMQ